MEIQRYWESARGGNICRKRTEGFADVIEHELISIFVMGSCCLHREEILVVEQGLAVLVCVGVRSPIVPAIVIVIRR
jgi:hypothetical protein